MYYQKQCFDKQRHRIRTMPSDIQTIKSRPSTKSHLESNQDYG